ncbi:MAG TPA: SDR family oxidoreductase [Hyphomonadaceae bacterium]|nr:SDR family oxidoreductase [Hyphomonadaceae bacterium]HPN04380.1 SDR family oxidoreductase [Hyphomonadaceae bacterium]
MANIFITDIRGFANPAIAERLRKAGARVIGCDPAIEHDGDEAGIEVIEWTTPQAMVARAAEAFGGKLDAIVISPAMPAPRTNVEDLNVELLLPYFQRLTAESLVFAGAAVKAMRPNKAGRIVFGSSSGPIGGIPGFSPYAAARAAVNGVVRTLALEVAGSGISVNAVAANFIQTETYYPKALLEDPVKGPKLLARVPMGRLGQADEVAALVELLALGQSGFISGQVIPISGAWC